MVTINYAKEWQRIANELELLVIKLNRQLAIAETDEERRVAKDKLERVQSQINRAVNEAARLSTRHDTPKRI
jgi:hypothetical protein